MKPFHADQHPAGVARSVSRRLAKAGFTRGDYGKYRTFNAAIGEKEGFIVHRIGYSRHVSIHWYVPGNWAKNTWGYIKEKMMNAFMRHVLKQQGYVFDGRGWIECGKYSW
jgi:hypothetical protein